MKDKNMTEEQCNKIWINNYGIIPPKKPNHIYKCEIINPHIKMIVTVIDNENDINKKYRYEIIKFNKVILDTYDKNNIVQVETDIYDLYVESETENMRTYSKVAVNKNDLFFKQSSEEMIDENNYFLLKQDNGDYSIITDKDIITDEDTEDENYPYYVGINSLVTSFNRYTNSRINIDNENTIFKQNIDDILVDNKYLILKYKNAEKKDVAINYEDSNWFTLLSIQKLLDNLKIKLTPYNINNKEVMPVPKAFIYSMDYIEILDFDIYDSIFKDNLNNLINKTFLKNIC